MANAGAHLPDHCGVGWGRGLLLLHGHYLLPHLRGWYHSNIHALSGWGIRLITKLLFVQSSDYISFYTILTSLLCDSEISLKLCSSATNYTPEFPEIDRLIDRERERERERERR
jgi:hypothetical protein